MLLRRVVDRVTFRIPALLEHKVFLLATILWPIVLHCNAPIELLAFDSFELLGLDDVGEISLVAMLLKLLEKMQFVLF